MAENFRQSYPCWPLKLTLSLSLNLDYGKVIDIISVYFPCFSNSIEYTIQLDECLSFIEDVLVKGRECSYAW